jgi:ABC-type Fe3+-hydroxamate transport system substrate-binding protein
MLVVVIVVIAAAASVGVTAAYFLYQSHPPAGKISVIDDAGRNVSVPSPPAKIVALSPSAMDILFRLGLQSHVVATDCGTTAYGGRSADYTPAQISQWGIGNLTCITWQPSLDFETITALNPGLVIGATGVKISDLDTLADVDGIPSLYLNPVTIPGIYYDVQIVGKLTGTSSAAYALVASMTQALANDQLVLENATSTPRALVTYYVDSGGYWTFGPGTFGNDLVVSAGGTSISDNATYGSEPEISGSYVLAANPDVIVVGTGFGLNFSYYSSAPFWSSLSAVQAGHVYGIDVTLLTEPDPSMVFGVGTLIQLMHPGQDLVPDA